MLMLAPSEDLLPDCLPEDFLPDCLPEDFLPDCLPEDFLPDLRPDGAAPPDISSAEEPPEIQSPAAEQSWRPPPPPCRLATDWVKASWLAKLRAVTSAPPFCSAVRILYWYLACL